MKKGKNDLDRRTFLQLTVPGLLGMTLTPSVFGRTSGGSGDFPAAVEPFPIETVRLKPSLFLDAVRANLGYLHKLEPDRLLHNFRKHAKLEPKAEPYGGWEADTIAGHSLGHYLTACALIYAQTGDAEAKRRVDYIVGELAACQKAAGDGYVAGFTRRKGDVVEDGRVVFEELIRGEIRSAPFNLNGCWVPLYNWHKLFSGLLAADEHCASRGAIEVAAGLAGFIDGIFAKLDDAQVEKVLDCEHGGINESLAELYARTRDKRWLALAERIRHHRTLDPMFAREDKLPHLHANTQIPKVIGLARLFELTQKDEYAAAARFFWDTVTKHYSYVIGGNSDREYFQSPDTISRYITEQTCESCNTYNMLKLTRHLFGWNPRSAYFDYYERAHLNHIMAHQNPKTGMFAYMIPLMSGTAREYSSEFNDFWCCVGSGMESHSKHGDSIYWRGDDHLIVNLFIPSTLEWSEKGAGFELSTDYPEGEEVRFSVARLTAPSKFSVALRIPAWCPEASLRLNGKPVRITNQNGYAVLKRTWKKGDLLALTLPMKPRLEPTKDDPQVVAFLRGPSVLAADLGPAAAPFEGTAPALVGTDLIRSLAQVEGQPAAFRTRGSGRPEDILLRPFYSQWERRTAVYFKRFTDDQWKAQRMADEREAARLRDLEARTVDLLALGEAESEKAHSLDSKFSYPVSYRGRSGRDARTGGYFEFEAKVSREKPLRLRAAYWGEERNRKFYISVAGKRIASEYINAEKAGEFIERDYPIPPEAIEGKTSAVIRFEPEPGHTAGPVFGVRIFFAKEGD
ncbi:MAG: glycoside hydrolase family 127 protein [Pyrinomonadaceae bacterium]